MTAAQVVYTSGGTKSTEAKTQTDDLVRRAQIILGACGFPMGPSKVSRLVRRFQYRVEHNGYAFFDFIANAMRLTEAQRRAALADPDVAKCIAYADPTGEAAVENVMRQERR